MNSNDEDEQSSGKLLVEAGWQQGSIFRAKVSFAYNELSQGDRSSTITIGAEPVSSDDQLVIVTQTCDILADINTEPNVEALACITNSDKGWVNNIDRNSHRYFLIDPASGLVALAQRRLQIAKPVLTLLRPNPWPSDALRFKRFVRWLARRYDRPALPDILVAELQKPITDALRKMDKRSPDVGAAFNRAVHDLRALLPRREEPPFEIELLLLVRPDQLSRDEADAIDIALANISSAVDSDNIQLSSRVASAEDISLSYYQETTPLFLEHLTYRGEEAVGLEPYERR